MGFLKRLGWYLVGLSIGLIFLVFFFKKKSEETGVDFCYLPNCRVLKDMRSKKLLFSEEANSQLSKLALDSTAVKSFLTHGEIDFSKSDTKSSPCRTYVVENDHLSKPLQMHFSNCDSILTLTKVVKD